MNKAIKDIIAIDIENAEKISELEKQKNDISKEIDDKKNEIYQEYMDEYNIKIESYKEELNREFKDIQDNYNKEYKESLIHLEELYTQNKEEWINTIVNHCIGDD